MGKINITETERMTDLVTPLSLVIDEAVDKGSDLIFRIKEDGSLWDQNGIHYGLEEMKIAYSRIFKEDPDDARNTRSTKIYLLRNDDGDKGILVDADGMIYGDARISTFIGNMEGIGQKWLKWSGNLSLKTGW